MGICGREVYYQSDGWTPYGGKSMDLLDPDKIKANLNTKRIGREILVYNCTSSTNDVAAEYAKNKGSDGLVVFAEDQSAGRGRAGARWHSGHAESILCSIILSAATPNAELLSLTCAVAAAEAIGEVGNSHAKIRWPNDIILNDKKVGGILLESKANQAGKTYIIGVGINCHQSRHSFPPELQSTATSIDLESHSVIDRISLAKRLLTFADHWLEMAENNSKDIVDQWRRLSIQLGQRITLSYDGKRFTGNCIGVDPQKGLILQLDTGGVRMFDAAHTSVLK
jgi:BirA family biotin operon repressor/biotin-[acetyl-CoA-carboxylase] ligase